MKTYMSKLLFTMTIVWTAVYGHGCATTDIYIPPVESVNNRQFKEMEISKTLKPYVSMFIEELDKRQCSKAGLYRIASITWGEDREFTGNVVGWCYGSEPPRIVFKASFARSELDTMVLVFHELGHCALGKKHVPLQKGEAPTEIMHPVMPNMSNFTPLEWEQMKNELFKECEK